MSLFPELTRSLALPVMAAPMFIASDPRLVLAQCGAGIIGSFPALNARPAVMLRDWLQEIFEKREQLSMATGTGVAPFTVNLVVHRSNQRLGSDVARVVAAEVPIVITSLGADGEVNDAIHSYGGIALHDVISDRHARKAIELGADGVIAVAAGAGGHTASISRLAVCARA